MRKGKNSITLFTLPLQNVICIILLCFSSKSLELRLSLPYDMTINQAAMLGLHKQKP